MNDLYQEERKLLKDFIEKIKAGRVYYREVDKLSSDYTAVLDQVSLVTKVSDRLQRKLSNAYEEIDAKNKVIQSKNAELEETLLKLAKAKLGRKASSILLTIGIILFILEEYFVEGYLADAALPMYFGWGIKLLIAVLLKFSESALENYLLHLKKNKIMSKGTFVSTKSEFGEIHKMQFS